MNPDDIPKTAITTPFGLFEFVYMTFGLRNAAQTFQRLIHEVLRGLDFVFPYMDDICVASSSSGEHLSHLRQLLERLKQHNLRINVSKSVFGKSEIIFLGHSVSEKASNLCHNAWRRFNVAKDQIQLVSSSVFWPQSISTDDLYRMLLNHNCPC